MLGGALAGDGGARDVASRPAAVACGPRHKDPAADATPAGARQEAGDKGASPRVRGPGDGGNDHAGRDGRRQLRTPTPQEYAEAQAFMQRYSPQRQKATDDLPEGEKKERIKQFVFLRYRGFQSLAQRDLAGYQQRLAQLAVEDKIFGLVSQWSSATDEQRKQLREDLRAQAAQLVDMDLKERQRKVERLQAELEEQKQDLEHDRGERDALVERRLDRFVDWGNRLAARRDRDAEKDAGNDDAREPGPVPPAPKVPDKPREPSN